MWYGCLQYNDQWPPSLAYYVGSDIIEFQSIKLDTPSHSQS